jgi:TolA-binding protein
MQGHVEMLQDARKAEFEAQAAREKDKKEKELAANRAVWQANAAAKPAEQKAREALKLAVGLLEAGQRQPAHRRLRELIEKYPGTIAAAEAEELLKE